MVTLASSLLLPGCFLQLGIVLHALPGSFAFQSWALCGVQVPANPKNLFYLISFHSRHTAKLHFPISSVVESNVTKYQPMGCSLHTSENYYWRHFSITWMNTQQQNGKKCLLGLMVSESLSSFQRMEGRPGQVAYQDPVIEACHITALQDGVHGYNCQRPATTDLLLLGRSQLLKVPQPPQWCHLLGNKCSKHEHMRPFYIQTIREGLGHVN